MRAWSLRSGPAACCCSRATAPSSLAYGTGGPRTAENLYTEGLFREAFSALEILELRSHDSILREGTAHVGPSALIDLVAVRPS